MANQIKLKRGSGSNPGTSDLVVGEVALRTDNGTLFTKKDDGNIAEIGAATGVSDGDKGDITVSNSGATFTIDDDAVTFAKMQNITTGDRVLGRASNSGAIEEVQINNGMIAQGAIQADRLQNNTLTASQIAANAIGTSELADDSVDTNAIQDGAITNAKVNASAAIAGSKISPSFSSDITTTANINLPDSTGSTVGRLMVGSDSDMQIQHDGSGGFIGNFTGNLTIHGNALRIMNGAKTESFIKADENGAVELYFNNMKRIESTNAGASITGDATISQDLTVRGIAATGNFSINNTNPSITLIDDSHNFKLDVNGNLFAIRDNTNVDAIRFSIDDSGTVEVDGNLDVGAGLDVTGNISCTGTVDGRDLATDGSKLDGIASGATNVTNTNQLTNGAGFLTSVSTSNISDNNVTFAKLENIPQNRVIGRIASGSGDPTTLTPANIRSMINVEDGATADQTASEILTLIKTVDGSGSGLDADTLDGENSGAYLRSNVADQASGDITFAGGAGAVTIEANSDITFNNGSTWSGNQTKIAHHGGYLYIVGGTNGIAFRESGTNRAFITGSGHFEPGAHNTYDLGGSSARWRNVYTSDLVLSNEGSSNDVDGTWGSYTIQEGEESLFLINKRNGKKYKFNLTEVN